MLRFLVLSTILTPVALVGCASKQPVASSATDIAAPAYSEVAPAPPAQPAPAPSAPTIIEDNPPLLPEDLRTAVALRNYQMSTTAGSNVSVRFEIENIKPENPLRLEAATQFFREDGTLHYQTEWATIELPPYRRYFYSANSADPFVHSAEIILRRPEQRL